MHPNRTTGVVILVIGILLLYFGLHVSDSLSDSITEHLKGKPPETTILCIVAGAAATMAGTMLAFFNGRPRVA